MWTPVSTEIRLDDAAREFAAATADPPYLADLGPEAGRVAVEETQSGDTARPELVEEWFRIPHRSGEDIPTRILKPLANDPLLPSILYLHGGGWALGSAKTHDRLVRELVTGTDAAIVFPEYSRSPEARYPLALEQVYSVFQWINEHGAEVGLDSTRLAVAGDCAGGNLAAALTLLAKRDGHAPFVGQLLFYPITDAELASASYDEFAEGFWLRRDAMRWFWNQYTTSLEQRNEITASPLRARLDELVGLPPALVITAEADVLRDEGEAYASRLREAGVEAVAVRYAGTIHDFVMLDALRSSPSAEAAIRQGTSFLRDVFGRSPSDARAS
jgi:acetyl esterase